MSMNLVWASFVGRDGRTDLDQCTVEMKYPHCCRCCDGLFPDRPPGPSAGFGVVQASQQAQCGFGERGNGYQAQPLRCEHQVLCGEAAIFGGLTHIGCRGDDDQQRCAVKDIECRICELVAIPEKRRTAIHGVEKMPLGAGRI